MFYFLKNYEFVWIFIEGDWIDDFKKCFKDFYEMIIKGYDFEDFCVFYEYLYMWRLFLIKVKWGRFKSV